MSDEAVVRLINSQELPGLLQLYRHLHPDDPELAPGSLQEQWDVIMNDPGMKIIVVERDGMLVASCVLLVALNLTRGARPFGLIENVVTHSGFRKLGYGRMVLDYAVEYARGQNCYKVMLLTGSKMEGVHTFYESCGFRKGAKTGFVQSL